MSEEDEGLRRAIERFQQVKFTDPPDRQWTTLEDFFQWMRDLDAEARRRGVDIIAEQINGLSYWVEFFQSGFSGAETVDYFVENRAAEDAKRDKAWGITPVSDEGATNK